MFKLESTLWLGVAAMVTVPAAFPQQQPQQQPASTRYASALYLSVPPEKEAALIAFYKSGPGSKAIRAAQSADSNFLSFSLRRVTYGGNPVRSKNSSKP